MGLFITAFAITSRMQQRHSTLSWIIFHQCFMISQGCWCTSTNLWFKIGFVSIHPTPCFRLPCRVSNWYKVILLMALTAVSGAQYSDSCDDYFWEPAAEKYLYSVWNSTRVTDSDTASDTIMYLMNMGDCPDMMRRRRMLHNILDSEVTQYVFYEASYMI